MMKTLLHVLPKIFYLQNLSNKLIEFTAFEKQQSLNCTYTELRVQRTLRASAHIVRKAHVAI